MSHEIVPGGDWPYIPPRQTGGNKKPWWAGWRGKSPNKTQRRKMMKKCGKKCFLGPNLSFPICAKGTCRKNKRGIMSAYIRAKQWGKPRKFYRNYWGKPHMKRKVYTRVAKKARKLMGWKKGGARRRRRTRKKRGGEIQKLSATDMMRNSTTILGHKINEIIDDVNAPLSKPPKSATKTSGGRKRKSRKKRGGGGYEERLFFTTMAGDEFSIALMPPHDSGDDTVVDSPDDSKQLDDDSEIARWMTFEQIQKVLLVYLEDLNYTIDRHHTNIHLVFPNRQVAALGSAEWRRHDDFTFDQVLDEAWVDKRILTSRLDPEDPEKRVPYYSELQPGRLIHIFLSHTPGGGAPCLDLEARARRRLEPFPDAVWGGEEGWVGGGRRKTRRKRGGAPHGNFIVGAKVQLTEAGLDYYTTAVEHARYLFGGREQPPDRVTAATWRGRINDSQASGWDSDNEDSKGYVQVQWEERTISWPRGTGRMIGYGVERPDDALPHLHPPIDYIKLARRKPPKSAMKKHTAKKKKHTTHPPINYDPPINYAKKGIYLPLTLVGGKRRKTRRRKTRSLQNQ